MILITRQIMLDKTIEWLETSEVYEELFAKGRARIRALGRPLTIADLDETWHPAVIDWSWPSCDFCRKDVEEVVELGEIEGDEGDKRPIRICAGCLKEARGLLA